MFRLFSLIAALFMSVAAHAQSSLKSPLISSNALFLYRNSNFANQDTSTVRNGMDIQEAEVDFYSDVDPYSRLNMVLSIHPNYTLDSNTHKVTETWQVEPEEAYAETNHIPMTTVRIGKFKAAFGKHNQLHTHAFPFVDAPVVNTALLGDEGLSDVGVSAAVLLPVSWYSEITGQYLRGEDSNQEFNSATPNDGVGLAHWKNLWDLSDALTMEVGGSYAQGKNSLAGNTTLAGADLTFKWRPEEGGKYHSGIFAGEYMNRTLEQPTVDAEKSDGWDIWSQYQFAERWAGLARYDQLEVAGSNSTVNPNALANIVTRKYSAAVVFSATEFSAYRLEYDLANGPTSATGETVEHKIYLQANFTIGAHPSHAY